MATVAETLDSARTLLGDQGAIDWQDNDILTKYQLAHRELQLKLYRAGVPLTKKSSQILTVPANTSDLSIIANYPTDLIQPISLVERLPGQSVDSFVSMFPTDMVPIRSAQNRLLDWCWLEQKIQTVGATGIVEILIRYRSFKPVPTKNTDDNGILLGETFLACRVAALCMEQSPNLLNLAQIHNTEAISHLDDIIAINVNLTKQMLSTRRLGYHRNRTRSALVL